MLELALIAAVSLGMVAPHLMPLERVAAGTASLIWFAALSLRALTGIAAALFVFIYLPQTGLFAAVERWCWHTVVPLLSEHFGFSGHSLADVAMVLPALFLAGSLLWVGFGISRAAMALRRHLRGRAAGRGPLGSTVLDEEGVVIATAGMRRPQIVVSRNALGALDEQELEASLAHELGHIRRRHRPLMLVASLLSALARPLPGTTRVQREFAFSLERDADDYAVRRCGQPLALASAICKAAQARPALPGLTPLTGRGQLGVRLEQLTEGRRSGRGLDRGARVLAVLLCTLATTLAMSLPAWALSAPAVPSSPAQDCPH